MIPVRFVAISAGGLLSLVSTSVAELPPDAYRTMQSRAPEALSVSVQKVKVGKSDDKRATLSNVSATARIDEVTRTATKLKAGDLIRISYERRSYKVQMVGPSEPEILHKGRRYPAFLRKAGDGSYTVAAGGYSFRKLE
jgi:hypothetical protein